MISMIKPNDNSQFVPFLEESTVCFNIIEAEDTSHFIREFDQHMQERQDIIQIKRETNDLLRIPT